MTKRHKVFVSYYHAEDQRYSEKFEQLFAERSTIIVSKSVTIGDIGPNRNVETVSQIIRDKYIFDATVTVVLIGRHTWQRKHVDWEIHSSLRDTEHNSRCGLLGIFLPSYPLPNNKYDPHTIPPRLYDNIEHEYAQVHKWSTNPDDVSEWIDLAFKRRKKDPPPDLSRDLFAKNRSGNSWQ